MKANQEAMFENTAFYEQLALRRLRRAVLLGTLIRARRFLWRGVKWLATLFERVELVREVGPGKRPLRRHEWEKPNFRPPVI